MNRLIDNIFKPLLGISCICFGSRKIINIVVKFNKKEKIYLYNDFLQVLYPLDDIFELILDFIPPTFTIYIGIRLLFISKQKY
jgi:hypothetical protein